MHHHLAAEFGADHLQWETLRERVIKAGSVQKLVVGSMREAEKCLGMFGGAGRQDGFSSFQRLLFNIQRICDVGRSSKHPYRMVRKIRSRGLRVESGN